jgi:Stress responsive A/B Barrel Domain
MKIIKYTLFCCITLVLRSEILSAQNTTGKPQQYKQVEIVTFNPGTSANNEYLVDSSFHSIAKKLPIVKEFEWGTDNSDKTHVKHIYVTTVDSKGDLTTYNKTPAHQALIKAGSNNIQDVTTVVYPVNK